MGKIFEVSVKGEVTRVVSFGLGGVWVGFFGVFMIREFWGWKDLMVYFFF